jgi:peptide/nickel transport system ATP-binding protein
MTEPLLVLDRVSRHYRLPRQRLFQPAPRRTALVDVSLQLMPGEVLGLVGESGSGKSTLGRLAVGLERADAGQVRLAGHDLGKGHRRDWRQLRRDAQMVFQDPFGSLDPRLRVAQIVAEPLALLRLDAGEAISRVREALDEVGLGDEALDRYPHEFSGGQRQRIAIARALITRPKLVVADEPVSALDVSVQAQVLNLMTNLRSRHGLAYLFISHDLAVVAHLADRIAVLRDGAVVETGPTVELLQAPRHPYTRALLDAVLPPDPKRARARLGLARKRKPAQSSNHGEAGSAKRSPPADLAR